METWFVLMTGSSPDGLGSPSFYKRTTNKEEAIEFYKQEKDNPYSTGKVWFVTDSTMDVLFPWTDMESL